MSLKAVSPISVNSGVVSINGQDGDVTLTSSGGSIIITTPSAGVINLEANAGGSGTVTAVSVVSADGFAGTVANHTTTPAITLSTTITGLLLGNGTAISQATAGSDYSAGTSGLATGILKSTTGTGALTIAAAGTDYQAPGSYITALSGDITASGPGSASATLATVNTNTGSFGSSSAIPSFTVNGKGLITAASTNSVVAPAGTLTGTTLASNVVSSSLTSVGTLSGLTVTATITGNISGNAATATTATTASAVAAGNITGTTLASNVVTSSLTTIGTLNTLTVTGNITNSGLTDSEAVFTNASGVLVSNAITGSGNVVMSTSPTLVTPVLGTPSSGNLTSCTGYGAGNLAGTTLASGVTGSSLTSLGILGNLTVTGNITNSGLTASEAVATDASKNLISVANTGTGNNVLATSPTLVTPALGTPSSGNLTNCTGIPAAIITVFAVGSVIQAIGAANTAYTAGTGVSASGLTPVYTKVSGGIPATATTIESSGDSITGTWQPLTSIGSPGVSNNGLVLWQRTA